MYAIAFKSQDNKQLDLSVVGDAGYALILPWMPVPVSMITLTQVVSGTSTVVARAAIGREIPDLKHLALTVDGMQAKVYFRGRLLMTGTLSTTMTIDRVELQGGTKDTLLSEMLLMPRVAEPEDIKTWWNLRAPFYDPSPVIPDSQIPSAESWSKKNRTYYQDTPPTGTHSLGDVWFDTSDHNRRHWWDGSKWVDAEDVSPIDASQRPVTSRGLGGDIEMDHQGMRFIRKADNEITLQMDIETGSAYFKGDITGASGTFSGHLSAERIIEGIEVYGGLTADHIKGGTISYDKLNVAYAIVQSAYAAGVPAATLTVPSDRDGWNLAVWPNINWIEPSPGSLWYRNWLVFNHQTLGTMGESIVVQFSADGITWTDPYIGAYMEMGGHGPPASLENIGNNKYFGAQLWLVSYDQVRFGVYTSDLVSERPVNLHVRFRRNAIG